MELIATQAPADRLPSEATEAGTLYPALAFGSSRRWTGNPNHHLWLNNGTWFLSYTIYPTPFTKERIRSSLRTDCVATARKMRDDFFADFPRWAKSYSAAATVYPGAPNFF